MLDRAAFPRDKVCGDGIAPEALDVLAGLGIDPAALTAGYPAVPRLRLRSPGGTTVERAMHRPALRRPPRGPRRPAADGGAGRRAPSCAGTTSAGSTCARTHVEVDGSLTAGVRRRGRRRGVRRPPGPRDPAEPAAAHRDRHPRLRAGADGPGRRAGDPHDRAALARLRLVVPARRRPGPTSATASWSPAASPAAGLLAGLERLLPGRRGRGARRRTGCRCPPAARGSPTAGCCSPGTPPR